ncbi:MAG: ATP-binding cassette domain-containing protein [Chloroflexi bacterium]|nr:ATP-binding cassette domain-containing protein [Chloroflexota bacterium]
MQAETPISIEEKPVLEAQSLIKKYRIRQSLTNRITITAVNGISFSVEAGETVALVGESGCGKTTVGKMLLGLLEPDNGIVFFNGLSLTEYKTKLRNEFRRGVQMVFQNPITSFNPMMSIGNTLIDSMRLRDDLSQTEKREEAIRLLQRVGLDPDYAKRRPSEMSGGQLQRVGVARALTTNPKVIFLDEPTSALDMSMRGQIINLLLDIQAELGLVYVLVSHDLRVVRAMAHYMLVIYLGQVMEEGTVEDIIQNPLHPYTKGLLAATLVGHVGETETKQRVRVHGEVLQLPADFHGCNLIQRCPFEKQRCRTELQTLEEVIPGRKVRCWQALDLSK